MVEVAGLDGNSYVLTARHAVVVATGSAPQYRRSRVCPTWTTGPRGRRRPSARSRAGWRRAAAWPVPYRPGVRPARRSVTLVARGRLLGAFPEEAAALVASGLRADGVDLHLQTGTNSVRENDDNHSPSSGGRRHSDGGQSPGRRRPAPRPRGDRLGEHRPRRRGGERTPAQHRFHRPRRGRRRERRRPWLYAAGDAAGKAMLTHQGSTGRAPQVTPSPPGPRASSGSRPPRWSRTPGPPTTTRCPTLCSPIRNWPMWAGRCGRRNGTASGRPPSNCPSRWPGPHSRRTVRGLGPAGGRRGPQRAAGRHIRRPRRC